MEWSEVRQHFPNRCVLVEALQSKTKTADNERIIQEMSVIDDFENGNVAWKEYKKMHAENPNRELYIFHTNNETIKVIDQPYMGLWRKIGTFV